MASNRFVNIAYSIVELKNITINSPAERYFNKKERATC